MNVILQNPLGFISLVLKGRFLGSIVELFYGPRCEWAAAIPAIASVAGGLISANATTSAANTMSQAGQAAQVNIPQLQQMAQQIAQENAVNSKAMEQQLTPEVAALRTQSNTALLGQSNTPASMQELQQALQARISNNGALTSASNAANAQLALGGQLPSDVQNLVARNAAATAGTMSSGFGAGLGMGRDINARDLGLTSMQLLQQRLQNAQSAGTAENNAFLGNAQGLSSTNAADLARKLSIAQYTNSIQMPTSGLNPGSAASLGVGNANAASSTLNNQAALQMYQGNNWATMLGQLGGYAGQAYNSWSQPSTAQKSNAGLYI